MFDTANKLSKTDPAIFETEAFADLENSFFSAISKGPTYICDICLKFEYKTNVVLMKEENYESQLFSFCSAGK